MRPLGVYQSVNTITEKEPVYTCRGVWLHTTCAHRLRAHSYVWQYSIICYVTRHATTPSNYKIRCMDSRNNQGDAQY